MLRCDDLTVTDFCVVQCDDLTVTDFCVMYFLQDGFMVKDFLCDAGGVGSSSDMGEP